MPRRNNSFGARWHRAPAWKQVLAVASGIGIIAGAATAFAAAWHTYELPIFATKDFVVDTVRPIQTAQMQQSIAIDRFLLYQLQEQRDKAARDPASRTSPTVQGRIKELDIQIQDTTARINRSRDGK